MVFTELVTYNKWVAIVLQLTDLESACAVISATKVLFYLHIQNLNLVLAQETYIIFS